MPKKNETICLVYALCNAIGSFDYLLQITPKQVIVDRSEEVDSEGVYYLEWVDSDGEHSAHYLEKVIVNKYPEFLPPEIVLDFISNFSFCGDTWRDAHIAEEIAERSYPDMNTLIDTTREFVEGRRRKAYFNKYIKNLPDVYKKYFRL